MQFGHALHGALCCLPACTALLINSRRVLLLLCLACRCPNLANPAVSDCCPPGNCQPVLPLPTQAKACCKEVRQACQAAAHDNAWRAAVNGCVLLVLIVCWLTALRVHCSARAAQYYVSPTDSAHGPSMSLPAP